MTDKPAGKATGNPTVDVQKFGQSLWYDNLSREMIKSGELQMLINDFGIMGMTSNRTIFEKAIGEGSAYDEWVSESLALEVNDGLDKLPINDVRDAACLLRVVCAR